MRLIVMRHAKSDWNSSAPDDHARPLNGRGRRDAPRIGKRLASSGWTPDLVVSSDSQRTRETWAGVAAAFSPVPKVRFTRTLYHAGLDSVMVELADVPAALTTVMVLGHNPGWEEMVSSLVGQSLVLTTGNAACLSLEAPSWREAITRTGWKLEQLIRPRDL